MTRRAALLVVAAAVLLSSCSEESKPAAAKDACTADQLKVERLDQSAASGTYVRAWLRNTSSDACEMSGYPRFVRGLSADAKLLSRYKEGAGTIDNPVPGRLSPDAVGLVVFFMSDACSDGTAASPSYDSVTVGVPGGGTLALPELTIEGSCEPGVSSFGVRDGGGATFEPAP